MNTVTRRLSAMAAAACALALIPLAVAASPASASAGQSTLGTNQVLQAGQDIVSPNGYYAVVQTDGNFVLYAPGGRPLWASNTVGTGAHDWLVMQGDGNLVLYNGVYPAQGRAVWANGKNGSGGANWLNMQTDGNLVEYTSAGHPVWATSTVQSSPSPAASKAVAWARSQDGQVSVPANAKNGNAGAVYWSGWCWLFSWDAWKLGAGQAPRYSGGSAQIVYNLYKAHGLVSGPSSAPPAGSLVFFRYGTYGHVAISLGGGSVETTQGVYGNELPVTHMTIARIGLTELGYVAPGNV